MRTTPPRPTNPNLNPRRYVSTTLVRHPFLDGSRDGRAMESIPGPHVRIQKGRRPLQCKGLHS